MCRIIFENLSVDRVSNSSGIFSGTNAQSKFKAEQTKFEGNGRVVGDRNTLQANRHLVIKKPDSQGE
ncbi:hypothetical protein [Halobacillus litoralis]|uniref:Uncharacterized protein n=1 Tax=Halobacillus litoralis TaxID=45668 RepID=A0A410MF26_9BACI|nr:hypothetical protein [Halobacillus litoralis]QAS53342.1 hypothetical protein HLI_14650 [Halobacillus litoralis]